MVDKFIATVKEKRDEALGYFTSEEYLQLQASESPEAAAIKGIDQLICSVLDVVEEQYETIVSANAVDGEGEDVTIDMTIAPNLSTLYLEEVNT